MAINLIVGITAMKYFAQAPPVYEQRFGGYETE